ncbi:LysR family transcriptional regulator [Pseudoruegeria sp. SK021]|uniref:LysR family transcriptional regulator n=1 Tax=Pseudoruegeria sp. SK021 TaxID=1933035 RepID=UPI000A229378|nr:LysR family transcriptional regulator [Pseudoruegeria sp. SK021]OSP55392.1 LysR family transcriptional regulator [Pseudoruegeria sp. SK021]
MRHLSLIVALADHHTTHRAASQMNMTQSTASKMLRDVEDLFQATLFDRGARGLKPTPLGEFVIANARAQLSRLERFSDDFRARRAGGYGTLNLGAISGAAPSLVARSLADIKRTRPQLTVVLHGETSDALLDMLENGRLDLVVGRYSTDRHQHLFDFEPLAYERLTAVARAGHALQGRARYRLADLVDHPWVLQYKTTPTRKALDAGFADADLPPPVNTIECGSIVAILSLVQVSDAVALLPAALVEAHLAAGLFTELPLRPEIRLDQFGLVTRKREPLSDAAQEFSGLLRINAARWGW